MRWCFTICLLISLSGCAGFRPGWIDENSWATPSKDNETENLGGHFEGDVWVPDNPDIEWTYKIPDISSGFVFDINSLDATPSLQVELFEFDSHIPYVGTLKIDAGVAYQRGFLYLGKLWTSIFEISTGIWGGWNWEDNQPAFGVGVTIIKF